MTNAALLAVTRNVSATWFIPTQDEWYKAAYYDGNTDMYYDYPTGTDTPPDNTLPFAGQRQLGQLLRQWAHNYQRHALSNDRRGSIYALGQPVWHVRSGRQCVGVERIAPWRLIAGHRRGFLERQLFLFAILLRRRRRPIERRQR